MVDRKLVRCPVGMAEDHRQPFAWNESGQAKDVDGVVFPDLVVIALRQKGGKPVLAFHFLQLPARYLFQARIEVKNPSLWVENQDDEFRRLNQDLRKLVIFLEERFI